MKKRSLRLWLLKHLPSDLIRFIRKEFLPWSRKCVKLLYRLKKFVLTKKIAAHPGSAMAQMEMAEVCYKLDQLAQAIKHCEKAIALDPNLLEAHLKLEMLVRYNGQEKRTDSKGNRMHDHRNLILDQASVEKHLACTKKMVEIFPDSVQANFIRGNAVLMAQGNRNEANHYFHKATKLRIFQRRAQGGVGPIFVASQHRSASGYIQTSLKEGLKLAEDIGQVTPATWWWYPDITVPLPNYALSTAPIEDMLSVDHTSGAPSNLAILNLCVDRMIVNVRDPRQGLISYVHYINTYMRSINNIEGLLESHIPDGYFLMSLEDQISWQIDHFYLPASIKWIQSWMDAQKDPTFEPEILFVTQEELVAQPKELFQKILKFYDIEESKFTYPKSPEFKKNTRMRSGGVDEWKKDFTAAQIDRATRMIPQEMLTKFNWSTDTTRASSKDVLIQKVSS